ncbi:MAG: hypothetical protein U1B84_30300 [Variovorax sp.]|nr:hypothetical protein [Variovorax sp.]
MSTPPDPFAAFESERTVIKPKPRTPGGTPPAMCIAMPPDCSSWRHRSLLRVSSSK